MAVSPGFFKKLSVPPFSFVLEFGLPDGDNIFGKTFCPPLISGLVFAVFILAEFSKFILRPFPHVRRSYHYYSVTPYPTT